MILEIVGGILTRKGTNDIISRGHSTDQINSKLHLFPITVSELVRASTVSTSTLKKAKSTTDKDYPCRTV